FNDLHPYPVALPTESFRNKYPVRAIAADPTRPGTVYVAEANDVQDTAGNDIDYGDAIFAKTDDSGTTWDRSYTVGGHDANVLNDDNGARKAKETVDDVSDIQAMPRMVVDAQGDIAVIWYDTRRDPANHLLDVFGTISTDGGKTFSPNFRITDVSFDADKGEFVDATGAPDFYLGDQIGLALASNTMYAAWTDTR